MPAKSFHLRPVPHRLVSCLPFSDPRDSNRLPGIVKAPAPRVPHVATQSTQPPPDAHGLYLYQYFQALLPSTLDVRQPAPPTFSLLLPASTFTASTPTAGTRPGSHPPRRPPHHLGSINHRRGSATTHQPAAIPWLTRASQKKKTSPLPRPDRRFSFSSTRPTRTGASNNSLSSRPGPKVNAVTPLVTGIRPSPTKHWLQPTSPTGNLQPWAIVPAWNCPTTSTSGCYTPGHQVTYSRRRSRHHQPFSDSRRSVTALGIKHHRKMTSTLRA